MKMFRHIKLWMIIIAVFGGALGSTVSAQDYGGTALLILNVNSSNCNNKMVFDAAIVNWYEQILGFRSIASIGGTVYADELIVSDLLYGEFAAQGIFNLNYVNTGGTATAAAPLPSGQPVNITIQILANNVTPIWETRFIVSDCDGGTISVFPVSGTVDNLVQNIGFEQAGDTEKLPAKWESLVDNDKRLCNDAIIVAAHSGNCAYQFKANPAVKAKIQQISLLEPAGLFGDRLDLGAWAKADGLSVGSEVKLILKYPTQPKAKLILEIPIGNYDYTFISAPSINLPETPSKVKVMVQAKGEGSFVIDDVLAQLVVNGAPQLSTTRQPLVPLPGTDSAASPFTGMDITRP